MITIPVGNDSSFVQSVTIDGVVFNLSFKWNARQEAWALAILDSEKVTIIAGIRIVANYDLLNGKVDARLPDGVLLALDMEGQGVDPGIDDLGNRVLLIYATRAEADAII